MSIVSSERKQVARSSGSDQLRGSQLVVAVWFGLFTGIVEVIILAIEKLLTHHIIELSRHFVWMIPLAEATLFSVVGVFFFCVGRLRPKIDPLPATIFTSSLLAFLSLLILIPRLHHFAALLLSTGLAVQFSRLIRVKAGLFHAVVRRTLPGMIGLVMLLGLGVEGRRVIAEHRALADLPSAPAQAANVILITLDTVRARNMSLYGYVRATTPKLEQFANTGIVFERALATASWTLPSHASMLTGRWPHEMSANLTSPLDGTQPTLAEYLRARGYSTAGFVANMRYCGYESGLDRGFLHYEDYPLSLGAIASSSSLVQTITNNFRLRRLIENDQHLNRKNAEQINSDFLQWLPHNGKRPFFAFLNYFDAHEPYLPPPPFDRNFGPGRKNGRYSPLHRWLWEPAVNYQNMTQENIQEEIDAYDGALAYLDHHLSLLFAELEKRELLTNTLVIITADHGEEFGEHGLFEHGYSLYLPSVHVPLILSFPGHLPAGNRVGSPASLRDLPSTILDLLDFEGDSPFPGKSLARHWQAGNEDECAHEEPLVSEANFTTGRPDWFPVSKGDMRSLVVQGMRYIQNGEGREELYDFCGDPREQHDLARSDASPGKLAQFRSLLGEILARQVR
jgi:arylsulfatase A-like enzyme